MDYKNSISRFKTVLKRESLRRGIPVYDMRDTEIMLELSVVQCFLQDTYKAKDSYAGVELVSGTSEYVIGSGASNLPTDFDDIRNIELAGNTEGYIKPIYPLSKDQMNNIYKESGLPGYYCLYQNDSAKVLELDSIPDQSYDATAYPYAKLNINYYPKVIAFDDKAGTADNITFPATGTNAWVVTSQTGKWVLPEKWHLLIIDGAIATVLSDASLYGLFLTKCQDLASKKYDKISMGLTYNVGISGNE